MSYQTNTPNQEAQQPFLQNNAQMYPYAANQYPPLQQPEQQYPYALHIGQDNQPPQVYANPCKNANNALLDGVSQTFVSTLQKHNLLVMANQILQNTTYQVPRGNFDGNLNLTKDKAEICNDLIGQIISVNPGLQVSQVISSNYYKTVLQLISKLKTVSTTGKFLNVILFFMVLFLVMIRMFSFYLTVFYRGCHFLKSTYDTMIWIYSIFFLFWLIDIFWYSSAMKKLSKSKLMGIMLFTLLAKEILYLTAYLINIMSIAGYKNVPSSEYPFTIMTFIIGLFLICGQIIYQSILTQTMKKLLFLTRESTSETC